MTEILASTPWLLVATVFVLSLLVGSFLNVVIHRLPIMLDRQWRAQAEEMLGVAHVPAAGTAPDAPARYNLVVPRSRWGASRRAASVACTTAGNSVPPVKCSRRRTIAIPSTAAA